MAEHYSGAAANCSVGIATEVLHKPHIGEQSIPSNTFLSGYTSNEGLNEELEEEEEFRQLEDPLERLRGKCYKIDSCGLGQERVTSDPTTTLKKIEATGRTGSEMNKLQMTPFDTASERKISSLE